MTTQPFDIPADLHYERDSHMWARRDAETGRVTVGIDALGLEALGDLAYVKLDALGTSVDRGAAVGSLEAAKMARGIVSPVRGLVAARNEAVLKNPRLVNEDGYGRGWLVAIDPTDWENDASALVSDVAIPEWVEAEIARYRTQGWIQ